MLTEEDSMDSASDSPLATTGVAALGFGAANTRENRRDMICDMNRVYVRELSLRQRDDMES